MKKHTSILKFLNVFAFIAMIAINALAQVWPLRGLNTQQISALYPTLITPAGFTFMIWIVIYVLLAIFLLQQFFTADDKATDEIGILFAVSCGLNIAWIFSWHYQIMLFAAISIVLLWACLFVMYRRVDDGNWAVKSGFTIYYAWITVASLIQLFIYLAWVFPSLHVRMTALSISVALLVVLAFVAMYKIFKQHDLLYGLTMAWSMLGIFVSHMGSGYNKMYPIICVITGIGTVVLAVSIVYVAYRVLGNRMIKKIRD